MLFQKLECFVAVAEEQAISRAAQRLNITQPHLSRLIRSLEEDLNAELMVRTKKGIILTKAGEKLLDYSIRILAEVESIKSEIGRIGTEKHNMLSIAVLESVIPYAAHLREHFRKRNPDIQVCISSLALNMECVELLNSGKADLAFVRDPFNKCSLYRQLELGCEPWLIAFSRESPLIDYNDILSSQNLSNVPLLLPHNETMVSDFCSWLEKSGYEAKVFGTWSTLRSAIMLASKGLCCAVCPAGAVPLIREAGLVYRMLSPAIYHYQTLLIWKKTHEQSSKIICFVDAVKEYIELCNRTIYSLPYVDI